jgi:hypothetical protein
MGITEPGCSSPDGAHITFAALQSGPSVVTFDIIANGTIAKPFAYYGAGFALENAIWENLLAKAAELCLGR